MNNFTSIAEIKNLRLARKLSQQEVALLAGIPLRTYQRFESGDRGAKLDTLLRVLDAFGLSIKTVSKRRPALDELNALYGNESE
jgi:transcriptional regulator with XRE-family HTH domain